MMDAFTRIQKNQILSREVLTMTDNTDLTVVEQQPHMTVFFGNGKAEEFVPVNKDRTEVSVVHLEASMRGLLMTDEGNNNGKRAMRRNRAPSALTFGNRHDALLLECERPAVRTSTMFGIIEAKVRSEAEMASWDSSVAVQVFQPKGSGTDTSESVGCSGISGPHDDWSIVSPRRGDTTGDGQLDTMSVSVVDLRSFKWSPQTTEECCSLLRSVLGIGHHASPWSSPLTGSDSTVQNDRVVGIVLDGESDSAGLLDFRVGDACPSYFLHSVAELMAPTDVSSWWDGSSDGSIQDDHLNSTLLVYRCLPPREGYSLTNSLSPETTLPEGCLWESIIRQKDAGTDREDGEGDVEFEEVFRPVAPPYIDHKEFFPGLLDGLIRNGDIIREEAMRIPQWTAWPETQHYSTKPDGSPSWNVFPLCHCFPANQIERRKWIETTCSFVPKTTALLKEHLGDALRTALFSRLDPSTTLAAHVGWDDLANHVYRLHLPVVVPEGDLCGTWVDGCVETHKQYRPLCFDDSKTHRAFNYSSEDRVVLILDLARPPGLPLGTASGGHTEELDKFIDQLT